MKESNILRKLVDIIFGVEVKEEAVTICGYTDEQILIATLCAESKGEPADGQQAVLNVIFNRSDTYHGTSNPRTNHPLYRGSSSVSIAILRRWQFSCWNGTNTCALFKERYENAVADCSINLDSFDYSVFRGATCHQGKDVLHYVNPKTNTSREWWVQQVKAQSNAHARDTSWTAQIRTSLTIGSPTVTWRFWRIGNHVFVSGPAL